MPMNIYEKKKIGKRKQIISAKWMCAELKKNIANIANLEKASILIRTKNYDEGDTITVTIDEINGENLKEGIKELTFTSTVNKDGFAELKEVIEIEKVKMKPKIVNGKIQIFGATADGRPAGCWVDCDEDGNQ
jgi:hypothetical protein